jgi:hypothetical protein
MTATSRAAARHRGASGLAAHLVAACDLRVLQRVDEIFATGRRAGASRPRRPTQLLAHSMHPESRDGARTRSGPILRQDEQVHHSADRCRAIVERGSQEVAMNDEVRRTSEMVSSAVNFSKARPDDDAGHQVLVAKLEAVEEQLAAAAAEQRAGKVDVRGASIEKRRLRREMLAGPIAHVVEIGALASRDHPELAAQFKYRPAGGSFTDHLTAARGIKTAADQHREVLLPYGLSESVLELYQQLLDQFELAVKQRTDGSGRHAGATSRLHALALEGRKLVRAMDARNRARFRTDEQALTAWINASTVRRRSASDPGAASEPGSEGQRGTPAGGGDVRPAA